MALFFLAGLLSLVSGQSPEDAVIRSAVPWIDSSGDRVYAGGANLFFEGGVYWMVGEGKKVLSGDCSDCFNLYKSTDLEHWDYVSCILKNEDIVGPAGHSFPWRMERPKIFKCPATSKFVMWFHCDTPGFGIQSVGVLQSDKVDGPYTFAGPCFQPDGQASYDMGTFVDNGPGGDNKAYLIRSVKNQFAGISQMTDDCLNVTGIVSSGPDMEGQAIMRDIRGVLHAAGSHLTGWSSNAAQFVTSPNASLVGALWEDNYNPSSSATTYDSQSTFIFPYTHPDGHITHIWMADRWNANGPGGLDNMTNIWLPLVNASSNPPSYNGQPLVELTCDANDAMQQWVWPASTPGLVKHVGTGLCVALSGGILALDDCTSSTPFSGAMGGTITNAKAGSSCLSWNAMDDLPHYPGNPVVPYACGSPPAWNEQWVVPGPDSQGLIKAALGYRGQPTDLCVGVETMPAQQWSLPWKAAWSLKDY